MPLIRVIINQVIINEVGQISFESVLTLISFSVKPLVRVPIEATIGMASARHQAMAVANEDRDRQRENNPRAMALVTGHTVASASGSGASDS